MIYFIHTIQFHRKAIRYRSMVYSNGLLVNIFAKMLATITVTSLIWFATLAMKNKLNHIDIGIAYDKKLRQSRIQMGQVSWGKDRVMVVLKKRSLYLRLVDEPKVREVKPQVGFRRSNFTKLLHEQFFNSYPTLLVTGMASHLLELLLSPFISKHIC